MLFRSNLRVHKIAGVREAIEAAGAKLLFIPPYSPDLNPIELAFSKLKALLRAKAIRTADALWKVPGQQQTGAVGPRRGGAAHMPQPPDNRIQIRRQPGLARQRLSRSFLIHRPYMGRLQLIAKG